MSDPASEIKHLLGRYEEAQGAKDLNTLADLHWQDGRLSHIWSPGHVDFGWQAYEETLRKEFEDLRALTFRLMDIRLEVFGGRFAVVTARWSCEFGTSSGRRGSSCGPVTFVLSKMGSSWKIVADHYSMQ